MNSSPVPAQTQNPGNVQPSKGSGNLTPGTGQPVQGSSTLPGSSAAASVAATDFSYPGDGAGSGSGVAPVSGPVAGSGSVPVSGAVAGSGSQVSVPPTQPMQSVQPVQASISQPGMTATQTVAPVQSVPAPVKSGSPKGQPGNNLQKSVPGVASVPVSSQVPAVMPVPSASPAHSSGTSSVADTSGTGKSAGQKPVGQKPAGSKPAGQKNDGKDSSLADLAKKLSNWKDDLTTNQSAPAGSGAKGVVSVDPVPGGLPVQQTSNSATAVQQSAPSVQPSPQVPVVKQAVKSSIEPVLPKKVNIPDIKSQKPVGGLSVPVPAKGTNVVVGQPQVKSGAKRSKSRKPKKKKKSRNRSSRNENQNKVINQIPAAKTQPSAKQQPVAKPQPVVKQQPPAKPQPAAKPQVQLTPGSKPQVSVAGQTSNSGQPSNSGQTSNLGQPSNSGQVNPGQISSPVKMSSSPVVGKFPYTIEQLLQIVVDKDASDLHITVGYPAMLRIDGDLTPVSQDLVTDQVALDLILPVLAENKRELLEVNREVDLSYAYKDTARFRINAYYERGHPAAAMRLIPSRIRSIEELKLPGIYHQFAKLSQGFVLVTGPTGHGKSTTLAAILQEINATYPKHIITIEDPIEYLYPTGKCLLDQREMHEDTHSWEIALRSALRQDPDVILVGEMRDFETIASAITLAETGHLVFATLHTNNAAQTIDRIIDVFPEHQQAQVRTQLSNIIEAVISQRLIPLTGGGRRAVSEVMLVTPAIRNLVREGKTHQIDNVIRTSMDVGMKSLEHSLVDLVREGVITVEAAEEIAVHPEEVVRLLK